MPNLFDPTIFDERETMLEYGKATGYRGVRLLGCGLYKAQMNTTVGNVLLGVFDNADEASEAIELYGRENLGFLYKMPDLVGRPRTPRAPKKWVPETRRERLARIVPRASSEIRGPYAGKAEMAILDLVRDNSGVWREELRRQVKTEIPQAYKNLKRTLRSMVDKHLIKIDNADRVHFISANPS